jgi:hypothetical protein
MDWRRQLPVTGADVLMRLILERQDRSSRPEAGAVPIVPHEEQSALPWPREQSFNPPLQDDVHCDASTGIEEEQAHRWGGASPSRRCLASSCASSWRGRIVAHVPRPG